MIWPILLWMGTLAWAKPAVLCETERADLKAKISLEEDSPHLQLLKGTESYRCTSTVDRFQNHSKGAASILDIQFRRWQCAPKLPQEMERSLLSTWTFIARLNKNKRGSQLQWLRFEQPTRCQANPLDTKKLIQLFQKWRKTPEIPTALKK